MVSLPILPHYLLGQLTHISRRITAPIVTFLIRPVIFLGLLLILLVNIQVSSLSPEEKKDTFSLLRSPGDAAGHLAVARQLWNTNGESWSLREMLLVKDLSGQADVLGASTQLYNLLYGWDKATISLEKEYARWKAIVSDKQDYRDGYIYVGRLALLLRRPDEARMYIQKAIEIDPNNETARRFEQTLNVPTADK